MEVLLHIVIYLFLPLIIATPTLNYPYNAQVPQIAWVGLNYEWTPSPSTFKSGQGAITYKLDNQAPKWLQIGSTNGTLSGIPTSWDSVVSNFNIIASDDTGSVAMPTALVSQAISFPIQTFRPDSTQALVKAGTRSGPNSIFFPPDTPFNIQFGSDFFASIHENNLSFYATMNDHTPLAAWINFNPKTLSVYGQTPRLPSQPMQFDVDVIASPVPGFAAVTVSFSMLVASHKFLFGNVEQTINVPSGEQVNASNLRNQLSLDGSRVTDDIFVNATADVPAWMKFDPHSISLTGQPPDGTQSENITIVARDQWGDVTCMLLHLNFGYAPLYKATIGTLNATIGREFKYTFNATDFTSNDLDVKVELGSVSAWLSFDQSNLTISGMIPPTASPETSQANMTVTTKDNVLRYFQEFKIRTCRFRTSWKQSGND
jgi:hypothetical protein